MKKILFIFFWFCALLSQGQIQFIPPTYLPNVRAYGAIPDDGLSDSTAFANWLTAIGGKAGYVPPGVYDNIQNLDVPQQTTIYGFGAWVKRGRSGGYIFKLADRVEIYGLKFHGNAPTYSGLGCVITAGNDQKFYGVEMLFSDSFNLAIAKDVGLRFLWEGGQTIRYGSITNPSIKLAHGGASQETNGDRIFSNLQAGGTWLIDVQYSQTTILDACEFVNMKFGANASKTLVNGCRIATLGNDINVDGTQCNVSNNIIAGGITINSGAQYNIITDNTITNGSNITDNSGNATNIYACTHTYTCTWAVSSGTVSLGNGTLTAEETISQDGYAQVNIHQFMNSATTFGSGTYSWSLRTPVASSTVNYRGSATCNAGGAALYTGGAAVGSGGSTVIVYTQNGGNIWGTTLPATWANGNTLDISIRYRIR